MMGKPMKKGTTNEDGRQSKISSFFQKGRKEENKPAVSPLFSKTLGVQQQSYLAEKRSVSNVSACVKQTVSKESACRSSAERTTNAAGISTLSKSPAIGVSVSYDSDAEIITDTPVKIKPQSVVFSDSINNMLFKVKNKQTMVEKSVGPEQKVETVGGSVVCIADTQLSSPLNQAGHQDTNCCDSDFECIPGTPHSAHTAATKKRPMGRSFLSSTSSLLSNRPPGLSNQAGHNQKQKGKGLSLKQSSKAQNPDNIPMKIGHPSQNWNSHNANMSSLLTEMGISESGQASMGITCDTKNLALTSKHSSFLNNLSKPDVNSDKRLLNISDIREETKFGNSLLESAETAAKQRAKSHSENRTKIANKNYLKEEPRLSDPALPKQPDGRKKRHRKSSESVGIFQEEPHPKRRRNCSRNEGHTPEILLEDVVKARGMRGKMILQQSIEVKRIPHASKGDSSDSDGDKGDVPVTTSFSGRTSLTTDIESMHKFSWNNQGNEKSKTKTLSEISGGEKPKPRRSSNASIQMDHNVDNALSDILGELNHKEGKLSTSDISFTGIRKKEKHKSRPSSKQATRQSDRSNAACSDSRSVVTMRVDENEADDALLDIMSELKETLTQQNELSTRKSSQKRKLYARKDLHDNKLDTSISRQLDFNMDSTSPAKISSKDEQSQSATSSDLLSTTGMTSQSATSPGPQKFAGMKSQSAASPGLQSAACVTSESAVSPVLQNAVCVTSQSAISPGLQSAARVTSQSAVSPSLKGAVCVTSQSAISARSQGPAGVTSQSAVSPSLQGAACVTSERAISPALQSAACASFLDDSSWLQDLDEDMHEGDLTSPMKRNLSQNSSSTVYEPEKCQAPAADFGRYKVTAVSNFGADVVLEVEKDDKACGVEYRRKVILQGFWCDTNVRVGDIIHVTGDFDSAGTCRVSDNGGYIIVNPDLLISGTSVVSCVHCMRRSVLNEKFKGCEGRNIHMLHGSIVHMFFQEVLQQRAYDQGRMLQIASEILRNNQFLHEMYGLDGVSETTVLEEIKKFIPQIEQFVEMYVKRGTFTFGAPTKVKKDEDIQVTNIADIEENVWSPRFGIKGKIDLTVEVQIQNERSKCKKLVPLELKTGRATFSAEHKGQVTLYSMMSSDRREDPHGGLLLYLREAAMKSIPSNYINKRGLIQLRNELAYYLKTSAERDANGTFGVLPEPINNIRSCSKCPHLLNCTAYQKAVEKRRVPAGHIMNELLTSTLGHLAEEYLDYFSFWCKLMHLEISATKNKPSGAKELWCNTAYDREKAGEALCAMTLVPGECTQADQGKFYQVFRRHAHARSVSASLSLSGLCPGDSIIISGENHPLISLSMGYLHNICDDKVTILCDRDLRQNCEYKDVIYRLDKCDTYNSMATNFTNLSRLMDNSEISERLRELIIDRRPPAFELTLSKSAVEKVKAIFKGLNKPQKTAVLKVLMCKDYVLIKGYPGTGKTSTIVALVRVLAALGFSVLLTSYTHSAVDNILLKLKKHGERFIRMGRRERIHKDLQANAAEILTKDFTKVEELANFYAEQRIVATTCLGTNHVLFSRRAFDLCIVDEASQVLQPACLGPLFCSRKFVLVGDPLQLPPVVQSAEARDLGMAESLFHRLDATGGTYELNMQYRMNREIMRLSNQLVYNGALKCGSDVIASALIHSVTPFSQELAPWVQRCVSGAPGAEVVFLDTDGVNITDGYQHSSGVINKLEAAVITHLCEKFVQAGVSQSDVGVIALYSQQVRLLRDSVTSQSLHDVEVNTVDQYQGRDKCVVIVSFVKQSGNDSHVSGILKDLRRLNVALTRAKHKLVMAGSPSTLRKYGPTQKLLDILAEQQKMKLPCDVLQTL